MDFDDGEAEMKISDLQTRDFFNIPNALFHLQDPVSIPAEVSFEIKWGAPIISRKKIVDSTNQFRGSFMRNTATIEWSSESDGFKFVSNPKGTTTFFAELARERNGVFFSEDDD